MPMKYAGDNLQFPDNSIQSTAATGFGFKNRIINGDMRIDQRYAGASTTPTTGAAYYVTDRFCFVVTQASKLTAQQNAGAVTPPTGFTKYLGVTSSSAYTVAASDLFVLQQRIEGQNIADLGWGTSSAAPVTLSFWVRSSLTGTFGGAINNGGGTRSYPFTYTINAANTWEQKSITIAGDTTGTWATDNSIGLDVTFSLGVGTTSSAPAGSWQAGGYFNATGATSVVGTNGATFYITGVDLRKGSVGAYQNGQNDFDYRPYGTELALCQRYCQMIASGEGNGNYLRYAYGECVISTYLSGNVNLLAKMRITPSLTTPAASQFAVYSRAAATALTAIVIGNDGASPSVANLNASVASGLTQGSAGAVMSNNNQTSYILFTAEL